MSINDYRKGCKCPIPPVYYPTTQHSSLVEHLPKFKHEREHLTLVNEYRGKPYNQHINRFDPEYWVVDYNALMVATIIPYGSKSFKVPCHWRTNKDFLGVRWMTEDTFSHYLYRYEANVNYSGMILAFRHNPDEPNKFTVTIQTPTKAYTYRLAPYGFNSKRRRWECLDTKYGTKRTYQEDIFSKTDADIPADQMTEVFGTKDYIYILDFNDLRTGVSFGGELIDPRNVSMISFDCTEAHHGLGRDAYVAAMYQNQDGTTFQMEIGGIHTNAALTADDTLQLVWQYKDADGVTHDSENQYKVISYTGFGTSNFSVKCAGILLGDFISSSAFYGKYLQADGPIKQVDTVKWFSNLTVSGAGHHVLRKRQYSQIINGMGMTSGFDDGYNLTPERQVKMAYGLGYRDWWTTYIGMSHYWKGLTAFQDKDTGSLITDQTVLEYPVLFAGDTQVAIAFTRGAYPSRSFDVLRQKMTEAWGLNLAGVKPINGSSDAVIEKKDAGTDSYWWNLDTNTAGPALLNCIAQVGKDKPKVIVWGQGIKDSEITHIDLARYKQATKKVFEYLRSLYGNIPIFIQELSNTWPLFNQDEPNVPVQVGLPTYLNVRKNTWGDIEFRWKSYKLDPALAKYRVDIYDPRNPNTICHSFTVNGTQEVNGYVYADWTVEDNLPVMAGLTGSAFPWTYLKWRVTCLHHTQQINSKHWAGDVPVENIGLVKKTILCIGNQFMGGYFSDLSDGTDKPNDAIGRKDRVAASTLRLTIADKLGLRPIEVMPVDATVIDSAVAYGANSWWDIAGNIPRKPLTDAHTLVQSLGVIPDYVLIGNPQETSLIKDMPELQWDSIVNNIQMGSIAILNWMRTQWNNPNLVMWLQGATTSWYGVKPPSDVNAKAAATVRDKQIAMATAGVGIKLGTFVPEGNQYTSFLNQNNSWIYYTSNTFHAAAIDMAEAIALDSNRALNPPDWTYLRPPVNLKGYKQATRDIKMSWDKRTGVTHWYYINRRVDTGELISEGVLTSPEYVFSVSAQQTAYAGDTLLMNFTVSEYSIDSNTIGAGSSFSGTVANGGYMTTPTNLKASKKLNGDIVFTWTGRGSTWPHFWVENYDVSNPSKKIFAKEWSSESLTWTVAEQNTYYGLVEGGANAIQFLVAEYDPSNGLVSIGSIIQGAPELPSNPMNPVTNLYAVYRGDPGNSDIKIIWDVSPVGGRDIFVRNLNIATGNPISEQYSSDNSLTFTRAQQVAEYGFTASSVTVKAQEHDLTSGALGLTTTFSGVPQSANAMGTGRATKDAVGNITMTWDKGDGATWLVEVINAENSAVVKSANVVSPTFGWTADEIRAVYGYLTDHVIWRVRPYREDGASNLAKTYDMTATLA